MTGQLFDFMAPLPELNIGKPRFMGEPAARHYRDIEPGEFDTPDAIPEPPC